MIENDPQPPSQPPLAEARWLWRRLYVFAASFALWRSLSAVVDRTEPAALPAALPAVASGLMSLLALTLVLYLVAPTAQQLVALLINLRLRLGAAK